MWVGSLLGFVTGPAGRALALLAAFLAWTAYQRHDAAQRVREAVLIEAQADKLRAVAVAEKIAAEARAQADATARELSELEKQRDELVASGGQCRLSDDQLRRLRAIR